MKNIIDVQNLLVSGEIKIALRRGALISREYLVLLERYRKLENEENLGILYREQFVTERNRIFNSAVQVSLSLLRKEIETKNRFSGNDINLMIKDQVFVSSALSDCSYPKLINEIMELNINDKNRIISEASNLINLSHENSNLWQDAKIKDKIKIVIPLLFIKWEREFDISEFKIPKTLSEFKRIFLK